MEKAKAGVEHKVSKILRFIQTKNDVPTEAKEELLGLVEDLHDQWQSLFSVFDDLQERLDSETCARKGSLGAASSSSSSDWEYYSSEETESNAGNLNEAVAGNLSSKEEIESDKSKRKIEALNPGYASVLADKNLRSKTGEKEQELTAHVKELERMLSDARTELRRQIDQNGILEEQIATRASEARQLGEKNKGLNCRISGLEMVLKEKGDEISNLVNKFGKSEVRLTSRIKDLKSQVRNLMLETDFLRAQNVDLAGNVEGKRVEEIEQLKSKLEKKIEEVSETQMRLKHLEEEQEEWVKANLRILVEKNDLMTKAEKLELEFNNLQKERYEFNEQLKSKSIEIDQLREENQKLHTRIAEMNSSQMEKERETIEEIEIRSMKLDKELYGQQKLVKEQNDIIGRLSAKIKDQQRLLKEQKDAIDKFSEDQKLVKRWSFGSTRDAKLNVNLLEKKMEELAEDFRMKMEDHIRILYRRIHVAEQIHLESKNSYIKENMAGNREGNLPFCETQFKKIKDMLENGLAGSEIAIKKLEEAGECTVRMNRMANGIDGARKWVRKKNNEVETMAAKLECKEAQEKLLKGKLSKLESKLAEEGTEKLSLTKLLSRFETRIKEQEAKVKEKEVELVSLAEEKRDAIRQLCVLVDYQRGRYDDLKRSILKVALKS
ncbi:PREDICTED: golgin subfamily A member 6-like protein 22 isoform X1 [Tarenaya hassleriana]|uniref:golgin subfamily A member 6-like protein 22 isoform X2 n=1 Tax=Tarenaya hassleriana TaxID=28532 RepID=UPI00053C6DD1|nr:PREDICTED: golgin subfamily A member 6-like protein 22 isoform X2 [Tarenaya hassleriana]XP_019059268.1 PREDICTED: golgin subfamily A member 6-like protein 22 isoform X1 [Tarenaya hassleriana]